MEIIHDNALTNSQENLHLKSNPTFVEHHNCDIKDDFFFNFEEINVPDQIIIFNFLLTIIVY